MLIPGLYSLDPNGPLVRPWLTYRAIHSAHRDGKIQRTALRLLMAMHYLPRDASILPDERVRQALQRSYHTPDVLAFFTADPSPAGFELIPSLSVSRMASLEAILGSFQRLLPTDLQPWHELWAMAVDGTSVFKEMQAGSIMLVGPMNGEQGERTLRQKSRIHEWGGAKAGLLAVADILLQGEAGVLPVQPGTRTIATMCDKLVRGMIKVMDERVRWLAQTPVSSSTTTPVFARGSATNTGDSSAASDAVLSSLQDMDVDRILAELFNNDYAGLIGFGDVSEGGAGPSGQH